jgi:hypothetical protein
MIRVSALTVGFLAAALVCVLPSVAHAAPEEDPFVAMCKRDGKSLLGAVERAKTNKAQRVLETEHSNVSERFTKFQSTCISGPKVAAVKSTPGYADVTATEAKITVELAALKQLLDAATKAEQEATRKRLEEGEKIRLEEERRHDAERAAQKKRDDEAHAAAEARKAAEDRAWVEQQAKERCTQNGQLAKTCFTFFTTVDRGSTRIESHSDIASCLATVVSQRPNVDAAMSLLARNASSEYAAECLRMMDVAQPGWRKPYEDRKKLEAFVAEVSKTVESSFQSKCGVRARLGGPRTIALILGKPSASKATFLERKNPAGDLVKIDCSGVVVTAYVAGGSQTVQPKTEAALEAEYALRACAMQKAEKLCLRGKFDYENGKNNCVQIAEAACK